MQERGAGASPEVPELIGRVAIGVLRPLALPACRPSVTIANHVVQGLVYCKEMSRVVVCCVTWEVTVHSVRSSHNSLCRFLTADGHASADCSTYTGLYKYSIIS